jgi:hypothetical protein
MNPDPSRRFQPGELNELVRDLPPPTEDDQSRTWDGRVLDTKEAVLEFLAEIEETRKVSRRSAHG